MLGKGPSFTVSELSLYALSCLTKILGVWKGCKGRSSEINLQTEKKDSPSLQEGRQGSRTRAEEPQKLHSRVRAACRSSVAARPRGPSERAASGARSAAGFCFSHVHKSKPGMAPRSTLGQEGMSKARSTPEKAGVHASKRRQLGNVTDSLQAR